MLIFDVYKNSRPVTGVNLDGAYLVGADMVPVRGEIRFRNGQIGCKKSVQGPVALALLYAVDGFGRVLIETARLPDRERAYNLQVELARGQLMRIDIKREDWGLYDYPGVDAIGDKIEQARELFVTSVKELDDPPRASALGDESLRLSIEAGEELTDFHAELFLTRRKETQNFGTRVFGCGVSSDNTEGAYHNRLQAGFDFACVPIPWREVQPKEQEFAWEPIDAWIKKLTAQKVSLDGGPLVCFAESDIPDWLYIWEHDYETVRDLIYEHIQRVVKRYRKQFTQWTVVSGLHAGAAFHFNFEQLMDVTRMSVALVNQMVPGAYTIIDLTQPWGEYYARNQKTIPPMLYADMLVQSGVEFDAFGVQILFGIGADGMYVRDLMQVSAMLDRFANFGKMVHVTAVQVPSANSADERDASSGAVSPEVAGAWRSPWDEEVQARWLSEVYEIALSKPYVASIAWKDLADAGSHFLPHGGLLKPDLSNKKAFHAHVTFRNEVRAAMTDSP